MDEGAAGAPSMEGRQLFVSSLLDPMILVLITLLQQIFSIYTGAQAGPSARRPSSWTKQEGWRLSPAPSGSHDWRW